MATQRSEFMAIFNFNGFATEPLELRRMLPFLAGPYVGEALEFWGEAASGYHLQVPPNTLAVVWLADGRSTTLSAGRHDLVREANHPIGAQFVSLQMHSFEFEEVKVHTQDRLELDMDLRVTVQVVPEAAAQIARWQTPQDDLKAALMQVLVQELGELSHEACQQKLPSLLQDYVRGGLDTVYRQRGLAVLDLHLIHFHPDERFMQILQKRTLLDNEHELEETQHEHDHQEKIEQLKREAAELKKREEVADLRRYVQQIEAQVDEDVFAMKQPGFRRKAKGDIQGQLREYNQQARLESIKATSEVVRSILENMQRHPGMHTPQEAESLAKALTLLQELAKPVEAPPIPQQVRSVYAVDDGQPEPPEIKPPRRGFDEVAEDDARH